MKGDFEPIEDGRKKSKPRVIDDGWFQQTVLLRERQFYKEAKQRGDTVEMDRILKRMVK